MKITTLISILLLCLSCKDRSHMVKTEAVKTDTNKIVKPQFQSIIDSFDVKGSILIYDSKKDIYYSNDFKWANKGNLPASTFKIANSIIGIETGVIENDSFIFKWDGEKKWSENWEQDLNLRDAFQYSCVPCYQEVARKIGSKRMNDYVSNLDYGNLEINATNIDKFWLEGESRISQIQQIDFMKRFYNSELPISKRTENIMRKIMLIEETEHYKLSGKTGISNNNGEYNGWFVGFVEFKTNTYFFATKLEPEKEFNIDSFIKKRVDLTLLGLKKLKVL